MGFYSRKIPTELKLLVLMLALGLGGFTGVQLGRAQAHPKRHTSHPFCRDDRCYKCTHYRDPGWMKR